MAQAPPSSNSALGDNRLLPSFLPEVVEALGGVSPMSSRPQARLRHPPRSRSEPHTGEAQISPDIQDHIGQHLRAMYEQLRTEPVPDHLLDLLKRWDGTEPEQSDCPRHDRASRMSGQGNLETQTVPT